MTALHHSSQPTHRAFQRDKRLRSSIRQHMTKPGFAMDKPRDPTGRYFISAALVIGGFFALQLLRGVFS